MKLIDPLTLSGIGGEHMVTHGGVVKYEMINTKGQLSTIETKAHHSPFMNIRLFSPQAHFKEQKLSHKSSFELFCDKGIMCLGQEEDVEFPIDCATFLPLMPVFHGAVKAANSLVLLNAAADDNKNLSFCQKLLHSFHYRMGHLGFQHMQWLG